MQNRRKLLIGSAMLALAIGVITLSQVLAQGPPSRGNHGRGSPWGRHHRRPEDPQRRLERYKVFLEGLDSNKNGQIDSDEAEGYRRDYVLRLAERAKIERKFPLSIGRVREGLQSHYSVGESGDSKPGGPSGGSAPAADKKTDPAKPLVPGFGVDDNRPGVPGFGEATADGPKPAGSSSSSSRPKASSSSSSESDRSKEYRIRSYAKSLLKQYDKNRNGVLEKEEWKHMRGNPKGSDRNDDNVVTLEELTARLVSYSHRRSRSGSSHSRSGGSSSSDDGPKQPTYRFLRPKERLPDGLPKWFAEKDADGDGQVSMAEYSSYWTDAKAAEFSRLDANNDGTITPRECLAIESN